MSDHAAPVKRLVVDAETLAEALRRGELLTVDATIPTEAQVVDRGYDPHNQEYYVTFEHRSWNLVGTGQDIPTLEVSLES